MSTTYHLSLTGNVITVTAHGDYYQAHFAALGLSANGATHEAALTELHALIPNALEPTLTLGGGYAQGSLFGDLNQDQD